MRVEIQESAKKDLKKIDRYKALGILKKIQDLESYPGLKDAYA